MLIALCSYVDSDGTCWPSLATIGRQSAIDRRKVPDLLRELEARGWINRERRQDESGDAASTKYTVRYPGDVSPMSGTGVPMGGATPVPIQGDTVSPPVGLPGVPVGGALTEDLFEQTNDQPKRKGARRQRPLTRLPEEAILSDEWRDLAQQKRPDLDPDHVFEKFKLYYTGEDAKQPGKRDWTRAWLSWLLGERSNGSASSRTQAQSNPYGRSAAAIGAALAVGRLERS